jgi:DNA-binding transcriptional MerR regulator
MDKHFSEEKMFYKIGEVCDVLLLNPSQLRFWEKEFKELSPKKNTKGERIYTKEDIELIKLVAYYRSEKGYTVAGTREALKFKNVALERLKIIKKLENIKSFLEDVKRKI